MFYTRPCPQEYSAYFRQGEFHISKKTTEVDAKESHLKQFPKRKEHKGLQRTDNKKRFKYPSF
jgi:hypothetical protein